MTIFASYLAILHRSRGKKLEQMGVFVGTES